MTKQKRKADAVIIMLAVVALNKIKLDDADYKLIAEQLKISQGRIKTVVKKMHPRVVVQKT